MPRRQVELPHGGIEDGEVYKIVGRLRNMEYTGLAKATHCSICRIGYDFSLTETNSRIIGDNISSVSSPFDENDIEFYEGSHPSI